MVVANIVQAVTMGLRQELARDKNVIVLGEDVGLNGGVFRATDGLQKEFGPNRVIDTPLAELGIVGAAIGMAVNGLRPVAEIQFSGFLYGPFDQLLSHAARIRARSRGRFTCPLVIRTPYGTGIRALELHCESGESIFSHVPGLKMVVPSNPYDTKGLLASAIRDPDPVIFYEPMRIYRAIKQDIPDEEFFVLAIICYIVGSIFGGLFNTLIFHENERNVLPAVLIMSTVLTFSVLLAFYSTCLSLVLILKGIKWEIVDIFKDIKKSFKFSFKSKPC